MSKLLIFGDEFRGPGGDARVQELASAHGEAPAIKGFLVPFRGVVEMALFDDIRLCISGETTPEEENRIEVILGIQTLRTVKRDSEQIDSETTPPTSSTSGSVFEIAPPSPAVDGVEFQAHQSDSGIPGDGMAHPDELPHEEAARIVHGPRGDYYDSPEANFRRIALMWSGLLDAKLTPGSNITPEEVAMMMIAMKLSRESFKHKRDNLVDAHGYLMTLQMVLDAREGVDD